MPNENTPNNDHWKDLVQSLDLDIDFDDEPLDKGDETEASGPSEEEKTPDEIKAPEASAVPEPPEIPTESVPPSKVDPLFDLGWNNPEEDVTKESLKPGPSEEPTAEAPQSNSPKESKDYVFGLDLFADEPEKEPAVSEEPVPEVSLEGGDAKGDRDSEGASDWMALAAQLGVPIRSEAELEQSDTSSEKSPAKEPNESDVSEAVEEEYDPLAAWQSPAPAARKPRGRKREEQKEKDEQKSSWRKATSEEPREVLDGEMTDQEESVIIGKPKDESDQSKKDRGRGRRRGRRDRDAEVESVEVSEAEEVVASPSDLDQEPLEFEEESSEEPQPKKRRRRSRRSRKSTTVESEDREEIETTDESLDAEIFEDEDEESEMTPKSHRGIPSWEEAISVVVDKNLSARNSRSTEARSSRPRGGRGRSGRRSGRPKE